MGCAISVPSDRTLSSLLVTPLCSIRLTFIHGRKWDDPPPRDSNGNLRGVASLHAKYGFVASGYLDSRVTVSDLGRNYEALHWKDNDEDDYDDELDQCSNSSESDALTRDVKEVGRHFFRCESQSNHMRSIKENLGLEIGAPSRPSKHDGSREQQLVWRGRNVRIRNWCKL